MHLPRVAEDGPDSGTLPYSRSWRLARGHAFVGHACPDAGSKASRGGLPSEGGVLCLSQSVALAQTSFWPPTLDAAPAIP